MDSPLIAILHSRPRGQGRRTIARVELAAQILQTTQCQIANLLPVALDDVNQVPADDLEEVITLGKTEICRALDGNPNSKILLAHGVQLPAGPGRRLYREHLQWLHQEISSRQIRPWTLGGRPAHPSRWQRTTARVFPHLPFAEAVAVLLTDQQTHEPHQPA